MVVRKLASNTTRSKTFITALTKKEESEKASQAAPSEKIQHDASSDFSGKSKLKREMEIMKKAEPSEE